MQCPICGQFRYKRDWRPSQWSSYKPIANEYIGCRTCSDNRTWQHAQVDQEQALLEKLRPLIPKRRGRQNFTKWLLHWENSIGVDQRKEMSRFGAVKCRTDIDPVDFIAPSGHPRSGQKYFDPMNDTYARVIWLLVEHHEVGHRNDNACGDLCEAWLGMGYCRDGLSGWLSRHICDIAKYIDELAYNVYVLHTRMGFWNHLPPCEWSVQIRTLIRQEDCELHQVD